MPHGGSQASGTGMAFLAEDRISVTRVGIGVLGTRADDRALRSVGNSATAASCSTSPPHEVAAGNRSMSGDAASDHVDVRYQPGAVLGCAAPGDDRCGARVVSSVSDEGTRRSETLVDSVSGLEPQEANDPTTRVGFVDEAAVAQPVAPQPIIAPGQRLDRIAVGCQRRSTDLHDHV